MDWTSAQLRSLVELTRRGTITAAAQALGYTPGGVSQQIAALERAAGMELLRRVGRRVELTDAGRTLSHHAERILSTEAEAVEALERTRHEISGVLQVGLFATAAAELLPPALQEVRRAHPALTVQSRDMDVDEVYDAVASGAVDWRSVWTTRTCRFRVSPRCGCGGCTASGSRWRYRPDRWRAAR